jgi:hypothetical protein
MSDQIAQMFLLPSIMLSGYIFPISSLPSRSRCSRRSPHRLHRDLARDHHPRGRLRRAVAQPGRARRHRDDPRRGLDARVPQDDLVAAPRAARPVASASGPGSPRVLFSARFMSPSAWFPFPRTRPAAATAVYCLPCAGASATIYRSWREAAPATVEIVPVEAARPRPALPRRTDPGGGAARRALSPEIACDAGTRPLALFGTAWGDRRLRAGARPRRACGGSSSRVRPRLICGSSRSARRSPTRASSASSPSSAARRARSSRTPR